MEICEMISRSLGWEDVDDFFGENVTFLLNTKREIIVFDMITLS